MSSDELDHHRVRIRQELDCAYRATGTAAVHAHFRLAALHMNRVDELVRAAHRTARAVVQSAAGRLAEQASAEPVPARC